MLEVNGENDKKVSDPKVYGVKLMITFVDPSSAVLCPTFDLRIYSLVRYRSQNESAGWSDCYKYNNFTIRFGCANYCGSFVV